MWVTIWSKRNGFDDWFPEKAAVGARHREHDRTDVDVENGSAAARRAGATAGTSLLVCGRLVVAGNGGAESVGGLGRPPVFALDHDVAIAPVL